MFSYNQIPQFPKNLKRLDINDLEAKNEFYLECLKRKKRRVWFPIDVESDPQFLDELTAEELEEKDGRTFWNEFPDPNHWGDCIKYIVNGVRFLLRKHEVGE